MNAPLVVSGLTTPAVFPGIIVSILGQTANNSQENATIQHNAHELAASRYNPRLLLQDIVALTAAKSVGDMD